MAMSPARLCRVSVRASGGGVRRGAVHRQPLVRRADRRRLECWPSRHEPPELAARARHGPPPARAGHRRHERHRPCDRGQVPAEGAAVVITGRDQELGLRAVAALRASGQAGFVPADAGDPDAVARSAGLVAGQLGVRAQHAAQQSCSRGYRQQQIALRVDRRTVLLAGRQQLPRCPAVRLAWPHVCGAWLVRCVRVAGACR
jgi:hypothetical protein